MATTTGSNKLMRILGPVIGLGVAAFFLWQQFGPVDLPKCDASETRETLQKMIGSIEGGSGGTATFDKVSETSFDEAKEIRLCAAVAKFEGGAEEELNYRLAWADKDDKKFEVFALSLPRCNRTEVQATVKELITEFEQKTQPARTLAAVEQISDNGLDAAKEVRSCAALVKFDGGAEEKLAYTIKWNDAEKKQYYVELSYLP